MSTNAIRVRTRDKPYIAHILCARLSTIRFAHFHYIRHGKNEINNPTNTEILYLTSTWKSNSRINAIYYLGFYAFSHSIQSVFFLREQSRKKIVNRIKCGQGPENLVQNRFVDAYWPVYIQYISMLKQPEIRPFPSSLVSISC